VLTRLDCHESASFELHLVLLTVFCMALELEVSLPLIPRLLLLLVVVLMKLPALLPGVPGEELLLVPLVCQVQRWSLKAAWVVQRLPGLTWHVAGT
jgi:hypothetical protein